MIRRLAAIELPGYLFRGVTVPPLTWILVLLAGACSDPTEPRAQPGFTFYVGGVSDTIGATLPQDVIIELRDVDKRPMAGAVINVQGRGLTTRGAYYYNEQLTLDESGRGRVSVRLGADAGEAWLLARTHDTDPELTDSVSFRVLPGASVSQGAFPRDTAVRIGVAFTVTLRPEDRFGNARPEAMSNVQYRAATSNVSVDGTGSVTALSVGRGAVELRREGFVDTTWVFVVPEGTLAVVGPDSEPRFRQYPFTGGGGLYVQNLDGTNRRQIAANVMPPASPSWSPDGSRLVLQSLAVVSLSGDSVQLAPGLSAADGVFSADGQFIYFTGRNPSDEYADTQVWRIRADGTGLEQISPPGVTAYGPSPSPDLTRVAYIQGGVGTRLVVQDLATGDVRVIDERQASPYGGGLGAPRWSPVGDWIAYTYPVLIGEHLVCLWSFRCPVMVRHDVAYPNLLKVARADGSEIRDLSPGFASYLHMYVPNGGPVPSAVSWSPDGEWLVSKAWYGDLRITLVNVATAERLPLNRSTVSFSMPAWMP